MLLSNLFVRHKTPPPRFVPGLFLVLLAMFVLVGNSRPIVGLVGIGVTAIVGAVLIEFNRDRIWDTYRKTYKKERGMAGLWTEPNRIYYTINVLFLWPFVFFLGVLCLFAAYMLA